MVFRFGYSLLGGGYSQESALTAAEIEYETDGANPSVAFVRSLCLQCTLLGTPVVGTWGL